MRIAPETGLLRFRQHPSLKQPPCGGGFDEPFKKRFCWGSRAVKGAGLKIPWLSAFAGSNPAPSIQQKTTQNDYYETNRTHELEHAPNAGARAQARESEQAERVQHALRNHVHVFTRTSGSELAPLE